MSNTTRNDPLIGRTLAGQYKLLDQLGQGGMGAVYSALDTNLQRKVAIKVVRPDLGKNAEFVARFNREARLAARLRHSNAVTVYGFGESDGILYLAMEMADGEELRKVIREAGHLPMKRAKKILLQVLDALNAAHGVGIVHRDLKPQNIIIGPEDLVKLLDFGVAKDPSEAALTQPGQVIGTVAYMAPEQVVAGPVDNRTDLYAVGCMLYQMLTGRIPFLANSAVEIMELHRSAELPDVRDLRPELSPDVNALLQRAMAKSPADRFQTAAEFAAAVKALAEPEPTQATVVGHTPRPAGNTPVEVSYSTGATGAFYDGLEGRELGDYQIEAKLGEGGMGAVFRARDKVLGQLFALKVMHPALAQNTQVRTRFKREARAALEFVHPNSIPTRACREAPGGLLYIVLDYSPGRSLRQILVDNGRLEVERALGVVRQALLCLSEAHAKNIVHRDLKPENMMIEVDEGGEDFVRVCDFGLAKILDTAPTEGEESLTGSQAIGTPHYMSPEQAGGEAIDHRTDLYAIGAMLYELLTGSKMFQAQSTLQILRAQITRVPTPVRERTPEAGIPPEVEAIVNRAISKEKEDRFQSADEFIQAIDSLGLKLPGRRNRTTSGRSGLMAAAGALATQAPTRVPGGAGGTSTGAAVLVLGVLLLLLGGTAGLIYLATRGNDPAVADLPVDPPETEDPPVKVDDPPETEDPPVKVDDPPETEDPPVKVDDPPVKVDDPPETEDPPVKVDDPPETEDPPVKVDDPPETEDPPVKVDDPPETEDPPVKVDDPPETEDPPVKVDDPPETEDPPVKVDDPPETEDPPVKVDDPPKFVAPEIAWSTVPHVSGGVVEGMRVSGKPLSWRQFVHFQREAKKLRSTQRNEARALVERKKFQQLPLRDVPDTPAVGLSYELAKAVAFFYDAQLPEYGEWSKIMGGHNLKPIPDFETPASKNQPEWVIRESKGSWVGYLGMWDPRTQRSSWGTAKGLDSQALEVFGLRVRLIKRP